MALECGPKLSATTALQASAQLGLYLQCSTKFQDIPIFAFASEIDSLGKCVEQFRANLDALGIREACISAISTLRNRKIQHDVQLMEEMRSLRRKLKGFEEEKDKGREFLKRACLSFYNHLARAENDRSKERRKLAVA